MDCVFTDSAQMIGWMVFEGGSFGYQKFSRQKPEEFFLR